MSKNDTKKIIINFEKIEYFWYNGNWITAYNNLAAGTSLSQRLTELAIKNKLLTLEDIINKK